MPRIGQYEYPEIGIDEALELTRSAADALADGQAEKGTLARRLGYRTADDAGFNQRLRDLESFGILEIDGDRVRRTRAMLRLTRRRAQAGLPAAVTRAVLNVPLFRALYDSLGGQLPASKDEFVRALVSITRIAPPDLDTHAERLWDFSRSVVKHIRAASASLPGSTRLRVEPKFAAVMEPSGEFDVTGRPFRGGE